MTAPGAAPTRPAPADEPASPRRPAPRSRVLQPRPTRPRGLRPTRPTPPARPPPGDQCSRIRLRPGRGARGSSRAAGSSRLPCGRTGTAGVELPCSGRPGGHRHVFDVDHDRCPLHRAASTVQDCSRQRRHGDRGGHRRQRHHGRPQQPRRLSGHLHEVEQFQVTAQGRPGLVHQPPHRVLMLHAVNLRAHWADVHPTEATVSRPSSRARADGRAATVLSRREGTAIGTPPGDNLQAGAVSSGRDWTYAVRECGLASFSARSRPDATARRHL